VLPPRWVRRVVIAPVVPLLTLLLLTTLPLVALAAAFATPLLPGKLRPLRLLLFVTVLLLVESVALLCMAAFWIASGFGRHLDHPRWQGLHYWLMRRYLGALVRTAQDGLGVSFNIDAAEALPAEEREETTDGPLIVLARHAGPGDSFLLVHGMVRAGFRPRIVLRSSLQWAPALDVLLNRVPSHFVRHDAPRGAGTQAIAELASTMGPGDALLVFPEGRNWTHLRRLHSIAWLEEAGRHDEAEEARRMRHVLTPRPGGTVAALHAAPTADVVFVAHTGLEELSSVVDLWRGLPMDTDVRVKLWRVPAREVPRHRDEATSWLLGWWRRIDAWIIDQVGTEPVPDAVVEEVSRRTER